jgi:tetrahydromethanopterin S-methyltransferase subunit A
MDTDIQNTLNKVREELSAAMKAKKCWPCGCFQDTVKALEHSPTLNISLADLLGKARGLFEEKRYECLGCEVCWPADAINGATELDSSVAETGHCPAGEPELREGWPPLPGNYRTIRYKASVAVCTLNSDALVQRLTDTKLNGMAIVGSLHTENLGIERIIRNILPNPYIRFLMVCGEDTRKAIGHLPGQSLVSLIKDGLDDNMRIRNALGKRPAIKNVSREHVEAFRKQVQVLDHIGETDIEAILGAVVKAVASNPGPADKVISETSQVVVELAMEPKRLIQDPKGYFVIYLDRPRRSLVLEHYTNEGVLHRIFEGSTTTALYSTVIEEGLISRLDHAAYLGRELARAYNALTTGLEYVQDRAPGELTSKI